MILYTGENISITAQAIDPITGNPINDATVVVDFFAPGKVPAKVPGDRTVDHGPISMTWDTDVVNKDGTTGAYQAWVSTSSWPAGKWSYRVTISSLNTSWQYGSFKLTA